MKTTQDKYEPFDQDVDTFGAYQYTSETVVSARLANERYTAMILGAADFDGKSVVDVGCGDGTYTAQLAQFSKAKSILGIEPSPKAVERARACYAGRFPHMEFRCGTSDDLLAGPRRFDLAVYRGVIHHVPAAQPELARGLALAQELIVLEPNGQNPLMKAVEVLSPYHRSHREQSFSCAQVCRWILSADGEIRSARHFGLVPYFCPAILARAGRWLEPVVECLPGVRRICCGQFIITARRQSRGGTRT